MVDLEEDSSVVEEDLEAVEEALVADLAEVEVMVAVKVATKLY